MEGDLISAYDLYRFTKLIVILMRIRIADITLNGREKLAWLISGAVCLLFGKSQECRFREGDLISAYHLCRFTNVKTMLM